MIVLWIFEFVFLWNLVYKMYVDTRSSPVGEEDGEEMVKTICVLGLGGGG